MNTATNCPHTNETNPNGCSWCEADAARAETRSERIRRTNAERKAAEQALTDAWRVGI